jgi:uncharacterized protein (DUF1501 family)
LRYCWQHQNFCGDDVMIDRRLFLGGIGSAAAFPGLAYGAAPALPPTIILILRGAMDGLNVVIPYGDPAYAQQRGALAMPVGGSDGAQKLDGFFALHPALPTVQKLFTNKQALFVQAIATGYRERSHFDAQAVLESGDTNPHRSNDGWLNRALAGAKAAPGSSLALAPTVPLLLRGSYKASSYAPSRLPDAPDDLMQRIGQMYSDDALLHPLWTQALQTQTIASGGMDMMKAGAGGRDAGKNAGELMARLMMAPGGPQLIVADSNGWDTHGQQGTLKGRLATQLQGLDSFIAALQSGLGAKWTQTALLVITEFGRTVAPNGSGGTDHGTASAAMLLGGAVRGGRVLADWPGLAQAQLYQNRDLKPTADLADLSRALLRDHFKLSESAIAQALPHAGGVRPMEGLFV